MQTSMHGTCVALGSVCAILRGPSGAGKSDLALRFLALPPDALGERPLLIADDQVILRRIDEHIVASCPAALAGKIEVRGLGIAYLPAVARDAELKLLVDLDGGREIPRYPMSEERESLLGLEVRRIVLRPFEASAPVKLAMVLRNFFEEAVDG